MTRAAEALGLPVASFAFEGRDWPLRHDFHVEAVYGVYLQQRAADFLQGQQERLGEAAFRLGLRELALAAAAGDFDWESDACARSWLRVGSRGWKHLCWLCLNRADPAARPALVDRACAAGPAVLQELDAARAVAMDPLARAPSGSASPPAPSTPSSNGGATAAAASAASTAATS